MARGARVRCEEHVFGVRSAGVTRRGQRLLEMLCGVSDWYIYCNVRRYIGYGTKSVCTALEARAWREEHVYGTRSARMA
jgi:hypothetical protein